jgi:hypothetical protein
MSKPPPIVEALLTAVNNIDWRYVTLSRRRYNETHNCTGLGDPHWLERPFAYEIYHQLRRVWEANVFECVIQAEVFKKYQQIQDLKKMPDLLVHDPQYDRNLAVVEIKLAANGEKNLLDDLKKLALFRRVLRYETLVEIVIGSDVDLAVMKSFLNKHAFHCDIPIHIITLSLGGGHKTDVFPVTTRNCALSRTQDGSAESLPKENP